jgi:hypothetical protein
VCAFCRASRRPAHQIRQLLRRRREARLKGIRTMSAKIILALSVKLSVKATANSRKFWRFNPNSL